MEINALTVYLALGFICAVAMWAEDFHDDKKTFNVWEYVLIVTLGPALTAINIILMVRERVAKRKQRS
jgi:hypothetical protein